MKMCYDVCNKEIDKNYINFCLNSFHFGWTKKSHKEHIGKKKRGNSMIYGVFQVLFYVH